MKPIRLLALAPLLFGLDAAHAERREFNYSLAAEIDASGRVVSADLRNSDVGAEFATTVENLVKRWRFHPAMADGVPATAETVLKTQVVVDIADDKTAKVTARYLGHGAGADGRKQAPPRYPQEALRSRASAEVVVQVTVDPSGKPAQLELHSLMMNIDDERLSKRFAAMTMETLERWTYAPERVNGQPVASRLLVPIKYTIEDSTKQRWKWMVKPPEAATTPELFKSETPIALGNATGLELISDAAES